MIFFDTHAVRLEENCHCFTSDNKLELERKLLNDDRYMKKYLIGNKIQPMRKEIMD